MLQPRMTPFIPHQPTPKQSAFLLLTCLEAFYGGAGGGGKSDALLMAALQYVDVPGYSALILRKSYSDLTLPGALLERSQRWLAGTGAKWNGETKIWTFPSGAKLSFGYLESLTDVQRYQSAEFQMIAFDELTQFPEYSYRFLFSRLRRLEGSGIPIRMRSASNPGNIGHVWVQRRFIEEGPEHGRIFIPAKLVDNPFLDADEYNKSLAELDVVTRAQIQEGDWTIRAKGGLFQRQWFQIASEAPAGPEVRRVRYWDLAATQADPGKDPDWTVGLKLAESNGQYWVEDVRRMRGTPLDVERLIQQCASMDGREVPIVIEQESGASGVSLIDHYQREVLRGFDVRSDKVNRAKVLRAGPASSAAQAGNISLVKGSWLTAFLDELDAFPQGAHDDQVDTLSGALNILAAIPRRKFLRV